MCIRDSLTAAFLGAAFLAAAFLGAAFFVIFLAAAFLGLAAVPVDSSAIAAAGEIFALLVDFFLVGLVAI